MKIQSISGAIEPPRAQAAPSAPAPKASRRTDAATRPPDDPRLARACVEFEGVLVRQLLASSATEEAKRSGYGSMVTDALSGAVTEGGGLGVADALRRALSRER